MKTRFSGPVSASNAFTLLATFLSRRPLVAYFGLAFAIAWTGVVVVVGPTGIPARGPHYVELAPLAFLAMLLGPSIAGIGLLALLEGRHGLGTLVARQRRWRLGRWYLAALITPLILLVLGGLALVSPDLTLGLLAAPDKGVLVVFALVIGLGAGFAEELGWTGFALPRLLRRYGWLWSGIVLGAIWGLWHLLADFWGTGQAWARCTRRIFCSGAARHLRPIAS